MAANITLFGLSSITTKGVSLVCLWLLNWVQCCSSDARSKLCTQMKLVCVQMREGEREREWGVEWRDGGSEGKMEGARVGSGVQGYVLT